MGYGIWDMGYGIWDMGYGHGHGYGYGYGRISDMDDMDGMEGHGGLDMEIRGSREWVRGWFWR
jgi:hypothetical protein